MILEKLELEPIFKKKILEKLKLEKSRLDHIPNNYSSNVASFKIKLLCVGYANTEFYEKSKWS